MKRQATDCEEMYASHISDKGLVSRAYEVLSKLNSEQRNSPVRKQATDMKDIRQKRVCIDGEQAHEKTFNFISHQGMQAENTGRHHCTPVRAVMNKIKS